MAQTKTQFGYRRHPDQDRGGTNVAEHAVVVVGAGPVGLSLAIDLAQRGQSVVLLDDADRIGEGSRAICFSKRSLEFWDRLGIGQRMVDKGVTWNVGKIFYGEELLFHFDLLPSRATSGRPSSTCSNTPCRSLSVGARRRTPYHRSALAKQRVGVEPRNDRDCLAVETPDGPYGWPRNTSSPRRSAVVPPLRQMVGAIRRPSVRRPLPHRRRHHGRPTFPTERWFWFDPPFHGGRSALLHKQPDDVWRIDLQLGRLADPRSRSCRRTCGRASRACSATTSSISNGSRSTSSSAGGSTSSSMAA